MPTDYTGYFLDPPPQKLVLDGSGPPLRLDQGQIDVMSSQPVDLSAELDMASPAAVARPRVAAGTTPAPAPVAAPAAQPAPMPEQPIEDPRRAAFGADEWATLQQALAGQHPTISQMQAQQILAARTTSRAGSPGKFVPAHDQKVQTNIQRPTGVDQKLQTEAEILADTAREEQMAAARADMAAEQARAAAEEALADENMQAVQQIRARQVEQQAELRRRIAEQDAKIKSLESKEIDPNRLWKNMDGGTKLMAMIGMALGGKDAVDTFKKSQDADIEAQKQTIQNRVQGLTERRTMLEELVRAYGDETSAELALRELQNKAMRDKIAATSKRVGGSPAAQQRLAALDAQLAAEQANLRLQFAAAQQGTIATQIAHVPDQIVGASTGRGPDLTAGAGALKSADSGEMDPAKRKRVIVDPESNKPIGMAMGENATALQDALDGAVELRKLLEQEREIADTSSPLWRRYAPGNTPYREWEVARSNASLAIKQAKQLGVLSASDMEIINGMNPTPGDLNPRPALDKSIGLVNERIEQLKARILRSDAPDMPRVVNESPIDVRPVK